MGALLERYARREVSFEALAGRFSPALHRAAKQCGASDRDRLVQRIEGRPGWTVEVPLAGLGVGRQITWLEAHTTW